jgi:hypothetical protein
LESGQFRAKVDFAYGLAANFLLCLTHSEHAQLLSIVGLLTLLIDLLWIGLGMRAVLGLIWQSQRWTVPGNRR